MPLTCVAYNCTNRHRKGSGVSFHRFPTNQDLRCKWVDAVNRANWKPTRASYLCSRHFRPTCFQRINDRTFLLENSVPDVFDFTDRFARTKHPGQGPNKPTAKRLLDGNRRGTVTAPEVDHRVPVVAREDRGVQAVSGGATVSADHTYVFPAERLTKKQADESKGTIEKLRKQLKLAQQTVRRERDKRVKLQRLLFEAQRKLRAVAAPPEETGLGR